MANVFAGKRSDGLVYATPAASTAIDVGDLVYLDSSALKPASSQADSVGEEDNQSALTLTFLGVAAQASSSTSTDKIGVHASRDMEFSFVVPSGTYRLGDLLGASEASSGTALEDQVLEATVSDDLALFVVTDDDSAARTAVKCKMLKSLAFGPGLGDRHQVTTATLAGTHTLTFDSTTIQALDPGGSSRDVTLPAEAESTGLVFLIQNTADAAENLVVKNVAGTTIATVAQDESGHFFHTGSWAGGVLKAT